MHARIEVVCLLFIFLSKLLVLLILIFFRLTLNNLTAAGLSILKIEHNSSLKVEKMRLTYTSASKRIQVQFPCQSQNSDPK
jgi:hypothetical protein